jgi:hypothetical protein
VPGSHTSHGNLDDNLRGLPTHAESARRSMSDSL